jgi:DNA-binding transcriptional LysR family regulator
MSWDLRQLRSFIAVAEELHFNRAAKRLNIAQPPLSQQIRQLEQAVGAQLLLRTTRRVELTPAGAVFLHAARRILAEAGSATEAAQRASRGEMDTLRVGFTDSAAVSVLPDAIRHFRKSFPHVHLDLREDSSVRQVEAVRRDDIDVALVRGPLTEGALRTELVLEERFCVALWQGHPLARMKTVPLRRLADQPFVMFPRHLASMFHDVITSMCRSAGFTPDVAYEAAQYQTILSLVAAEVGVSIVPLSVRNIARAGVAFRPLQGASATAQVVAVLRPERSSPVLEGFLRSFRG